MQQSAAQMYSQTVKKTASPRELEANLLSKSARQIQNIRDNWDQEKETLKDVLEYNRKLWTIFLTSVTKEDNPLPQPIKQNVANLGLFVMNHTMELMSNPKPESLTVLININRELAEGLRS